MNANWRNPAWKYRKACETNIRLTFVRIRKEQRERDKAIEAAQISVVPLKRGKA